MQKLMNGRSIDLGVCYYPEHWDEREWETDLNRMLETGIGTVRIAEFAWNKVEPEEGMYTFDFWRRFLDLCAKKGMQVIFGTPTATPPAWLTTKYPEVLNADRDGNLYRHGTRRHYNYNSSVYREKARRIVEQLAIHYGQHIAIVGWQLDNEFNCENGEFYSESDSAVFRDFVKRKYGTLDALNDAWGTVFWNQTYTEWKQVDVPRRTNTGSMNPHRLLDYYRFISESVCSFANEQAEIIRKYKKPGDFITTNGIFGNIDYARMSEESLDVLTYDSYPNFGYCLDSFYADDEMKDRHWSRNLAEVRAVSPIFGIMEQQSGANGWTDRMEAPTPRPGQITLWTMQSIAHGADYISFFRWRTCPFGTEMYWHGILDYSGRANRRLSEVKELAGKLARLQPVAGGEYAAKVGILKDYDNIWDAQADRWHDRIDRGSQEALFRELQLEHVPYDYVYWENVQPACPNREACPGEACHGKAISVLTKYDVIFYPHGQILTPERAELLREYVEGGGRLIVGCRSGLKDIHGKCVTMHLPGLLAELCGTDVTEYSFVAPDEAPVMADWDGAQMAAAVFNELLDPIGTGEVAAVYAGSYYAGTPALIHNRYGKGETWYYGGGFGRDTVRVFLDKLGLAEPWREYLTLPSECELAVRRANGKNYYFVLNYAHEEVRITVRKEMKELLTGETLGGELRIEKYGVRVFEEI